MVGAGCWCIVSYCLRTKFFFFPSLQPKHTFTHKPHTNHTHYFFLLPWLTIGRSGGSSRGRGAAAAAAAAALNFSLALRAMQLKFLICVPAATALYSFYSFIVFFFSSFPLNSTLHVCQVRLFVLDASRYNFPSCYSSSS